MNIKCSIDSINALIVQFSIHQVNWSISIITSHSMNMAQSRAKMLSNVQIDDQFIPSLAQKCDAIEIISKMMKGKLTADDFESFFLEHDILNMLVASEECVQEEILLFIKRSVQESQTIRDYMFDCFLDPIANCVLSPCSLSDRMILKLMNALVDGDLGNNELECVTKLLDMIPYCKQDLPTRIDLLFKTSMCLEDNDRKYALALRKSIREIFDTVHGGSVGLLDSADIWKILIAAERIVTKSGMMLKKDFVMPILERYRMTCFLPKLCGSPILCEYETLPFLFKESTNSTQPRDI